MSSTSSVFPKSIKKAAMENCGGWQPMLVSGSLSNNYFLVSGFFFEVAYSACTVCRFLFLKERSHGLQFIVFLIK
jgi:hypothetical protein